MQNPQPHPDWLGQNPHGYGPDPQGIRLPCFLKSYSPYLKTVFQMSGTVLTAACIISSDPYHNL